MDAEPLSDVVAKGDTRASLEALRDRLAQAFDEAKYTKDLPPLAKQLCDVMKALDELPDDRRESAVDDLQKARAARRKKAAGPSGT